MTVAASASAEEAPPPAASQPAPAATAPGTDSKAAQKPAAQEPAADKHADKSGIDLLAGIRISGYLQAQYESHQDSENQLQQGGAPLNLDRFVLRRARVRVERIWKFSSVMVEFDANTVHGPSSFGVQHAEASLFYRGDNPESELPVAKLTMGLFDVPFGYELTESPKARPFMERSLASLAFFPAEPDLGVGLSGKVSFVKYAVAVMNGEPKSEVTGFQLRDPNSQKDVVGRVGVDVPIGERFRVSGGVSAINGYGFYKGTDNTKSVVVWTDLNEDGQINTGELQALPGTSGTVSQNFFRWAVGADLQIRMKSKLGMTQLYGELTAGSNMDRGLFVADPVLTSIDARELGYYIGLVQQVTPYGVVGLRYDYYNPNADFLDRQGGRIVPSTQDIQTWSPLVGVVLPERAKLLFEYDFIRDYLARDKSGVPADRKNNVWTVRLQGEL